jgi:hypothetical protein
MWRHGLLIPPLSAFRDFRNISETVKARRDVSKEHQYETKIDLSIGQVVSARWRHLPPVPANDLFHDF